MLTNRKQNISAGLCMAVGAGSYTVNDVFMKLLAQELPIFQALFLRGLLTTAFFGVLFWPYKKTLVTLKKKDHWLLAIRSISEAAAAFFFVKALLQMPIANLTAVMYVIPLSTAFVAYIFLREPLGWGRSFAIFFAFIGMTLITRPVAEGFTTFFLPLATVFAITIRDLVTRMMSDSPPSVSLAFFGSLGVTLFSVAGSTGQEWVIPSLHGWGWLIGAALFIALGYAMIIRATRIGELTFIAPFRYSSILFALVAGWIIFAEWPHHLAFIGGGVVLISALYAFSIEAFRYRRQTPNGQ